MFRVHTYTCYFLFVENTCVGPTKKFVMGYKWPGWRAKGLNVALQIRRNLFLAHGWIWVWHYFHATFGLWPMAGDGLTKLYWHKFPFL
jgi:hypothetical protein